MNILVSKIIITEWSVTPAVRNTLQSIGVAGCDRTNQSQNKQHHIEHHNHQQMVKFYTAVQLSKSVYKF